MITIGILNLQGAVSEHFEQTKKAIEKMKANNEITEEEIEVKSVRFVDEVANCSGLIISGGESTVIGKLMEERNISKVIMGNGIPVFGTCAGMVLLSKKIDYDQHILKLMDVNVKRNAFGSQKNSFEKEIMIFGEKFHGVFIRAPAIVGIDENDVDDVEILSTMIDESTNEELIIAAKQGNNIAIAFHPELTEDTRLHEYFIKKLLDIEN